MQTQAIGINNATDYFVVVRFPWGGQYPSQILITASGKQLMYYRTCSNGIWDTPKKVITDADIQYGIVTVNAAQNETTEFNVTFPRQFSSTPQVVVTVATSGPKDNIASVLSITPNGFMGYLYRGGVTANMSIRWIAVGS